ncbi:MAG: hypothetical protein IKE64_14915 [Thermoguttaceae bacterium]|nr:hypothetical protein [Thermoguttaceae bacterium]
MTHYPPTSKTHEIPPASARHLARTERSELQEQLRRVCTPQSDPLYADDNIPQITYHQAHGLTE